MIGGLGLLQPPKKWTKNKPVVVAKKPPKKVAKNKPCTPQASAAPPTAASSAAPARPSTSARRSWPTSTSTATTAPSLLPTTRPPGTSGTRFAMRATTDTFAGKNSCTILFQVFFQHFF